MSGQTTMSKAGWCFNNSYEHLPDLFFTRLNPSPVKAPQMIIFNQPLARRLGLNKEELLNEYGTEIFAGNQIPEGAMPLAQAYAGHQFGHFTMLGDGRALLLGEQITPHGKRFDIQLKGSGRTPYSRGGDGRAALGPMLREYIISEAMAALGIPTTRSLAVVTTGQAVIRQEEEIGAILTRVAASHIRVGTFQYAARWGSIQDLQSLADYTLQRHFKTLDGEENPYLFLLKEIIKRQAKLIAKWQLVGFIHGVMNTDNVAVSGETIDYGPCAFMDTYDPKTVFSSIDTHGRYAYGNQPAIAVWNLARFAETLLPLLHEDENQAVRLAENTLSIFNEVFQQHWMNGMRAKLGLFNEKPEDDELIKSLLEMMEKHQADYTNTFIALAFDKFEDGPLFKSQEFKIWFEKWQVRLNDQEESKALSKQLMQSSNPSVIPRNHRVEEALEAAVKHGDYGVMEKLLKVLETPYAHTKEQAEYAKLPPPSACAYRTFCGT